MRDSGALTPPETRARLQERARALAKEPATAIPGQAVLELVAFRLASETYAVATGFVREVIALTEYTPVPGVPPFVLGLVSVHGQILSLVDLKKLFHLPAQGLGQLNQVLILHNERMAFGILADEILGTLALGLEALQPAPLTVSGTGPHYLRGVSAERVMVLDAAALLNDPSLVVHQAAE